MIVDIVCAQLFISGLIPRSQMSPQATNSLLQLRFKNPENMHCLRLREPPFCCCSESGTFMAEVFGWTCSGRIKQVATRPLCKKDDRQARVAFAYK